MSNLKYEPLSTLNDKPIYEITLQTECPDFTHAYDRIILTDDGATFIKKYCDNYKSCKNFNSDKCCNTEKRIR